MTARTFAVRAGSDSAPRLHDDLASALGDADRLRAQLEQMVATNHNLSALLLSTDARSGEIMKMLVAVRALIESRNASAAIAGLHDILVNVVGAADFTIYSLDADADELRPLTGVGASFCPDISLPLGNSWLGGVIRDGQVLIAPARSNRFRASSVPAVAVVPLTVLDRVLGAILIADVLPQREPLDLCDRDILGLLGAYAATAIIAAERRGEWHSLSAVLQ